jgi:uncharacterized protein YdeI (YjbR/CyaY-like superfamily)
MTRELACSQSGENKTMEKKNTDNAGVPSELQELLAGNPAELEFFASLAPSHKKAYCEWVGSAKQEATRQTRAGKALLMLKNRQKTLKTV